MTECHYQPATYPVMRGQHIWRYTPRGDPYLTWETHIPRIHDQYLECTVYLYASTDDAEKGERTGGSGFIASVPCERLPNRAFMYCVTNAHVIESGGCTIRFNGRGEGLVTLETLEKDWLLHPEKDDLAIYLLPVIDLNVIQAKSISSTDFITKAVADDVNLGAGDEVFFAGRFVNSEGKQRNTPALRFGNISQMYPEPISQPRIFGPFLQQSILVEGRSISGYSGSPVFTMLTSLYHRQNVKPLKEDMLRLIGVVWGYITSKEKIRDAAGRETDNTVTMNTGMMGVVPVWKLEEMFNLPAVKSRRDEIEEMEIRKRPASVSELASASPATATVPAPDNPSHKEDFMSLLGAAAATKKPTS